MRRDDPAAPLDPAQARAAGTGLKTLIPDSRGRPFLDHILGSLADAGVARVVLVVAPDATAIREHLDRHPPRRLAIAWAIQQEPRGTADAVVAAEALVGDAPFLVLNADNLYPVAAIRAMVTLGEPGLVAFDREALVREGNIDAARVAAFAPLQLDARGYLVSLVEKPGGPVDAQWVSMNLWRFDRRIFDACRAVPRSVRGEFELPQAVLVALAQGGTFRAATCHAGVLDLSHRGDIAGVAALLGQADPSP